VNHAPKPPIFETVTYQVRSKKRYTPLNDRALLELVKTAGIPLAGTPRLAALAGGKLVGIYVLPSNNVVEIYAAADGSGDTGYLFPSLDVWMTFGAGVEYR
jgi:hypothetical protein